MKTPETAADSPCILQKYKPFLRALKAYNCRICSQSNLRSSAFDAFCATSLSSAAVILIVLISWNSIENIADTSEFVVALPFAIGLVLAESIILEMMWKNQLINGTIERLQRAIDQRQCFVLISAFRTAF